MGGVRPRGPRPRMTGKAGSRGAAGRSPWAGLRVGHGFDAHRLVAGRALRLGGLDVPHPRGLEGHSDGDCVLHAVCDALLGAAGLGDMGRHFPSREARWRGAASRVFLEEVHRLLSGAGCSVVNVDVTIVAQEPVLAPHLDPMRDTIAAVLGVEPGRVSMKAKSTDHLGALGRGEGIAAIATALLHRGP
jgi:2-C-methyl-D-erythritol 2,4-cyclodiphosphate synthase